MGGFYICFLMMLFVFVFVFVVLLLWLFFVFVLCCIVFVISCFIIFCFLILSETFVGQFGGLIFGPPFRSLIWRGVPEGFWPSGVFINVDQTFLGLSNLGGILMESEGQVARLRARARSLALVLVLALVLWLQQASTRTKTSCFVCWKAWKPLCANGVRTHFARIAFAPRGV